MNRRIRWGILGTGRIARHFATALNRLPDAELAAVGSRTGQSADSFGTEFQIPRRYSSYESLVRDPEVDVIYVATPHSGHASHAGMALDAGKAVLCEKPLTINATEAAGIIQKARAQNLFLMEAMWTRFYPLMVKLRELVQAGAIGELRLLTADFGFRAAYEEEPRLFGPEYGGGALLDVGVYPVSLASMLFGPPTGIQGTASIGPTGVDEESMMVLSHDSGRSALLHAAIRLETAQEAILTGTDGRIRIQSPWWRPTRMTISRVGRPDEHLDFPVSGNGYEYEAVEVMSCLRAGRLESPVMPLDESLSILRTLDTLRGQWGLRYPME